MYKYLVVTGNFNLKISQHHCLRLRYVCSCLIGRVATDLENLEKLGNESQGICLKSQGICHRIPKVREKSGNFVWNSFSAKLKILIFKIFWGACPQSPLNGLGLKVELNLCLEKSGNFILSGKWQNMAEISDHVATCLKLRTLPAKENLRCPYT